MTDDLIRPAASPVRSAANIEGLFRIWLKRPSYRRGAPACNARLRFWHVLIAAILCCICGLPGTSFAQQPTYRILPEPAARPPRLQSEPAVLQGRSAIVLSAAYSRDGRQLTTVDGEGRVAEWDLMHPGSERRPERLEQQLPGVVRVDDVVVPGERQRVIALDRELACALIWDQGAENARLLAFAEQDGSVSILELATGKYRLQDGPQKTRTVALAVSDDGRRLASVSEAGEVRLWDAQRGKQIGALSTRAGPVQAAAFSHDGKQLAVGSYASEVRLFDLASPEKSSPPNDPRILDIGSSRVTAVAFSHDDRRLVIATADGATRVLTFGQSDPPVSLGTHTFAVWRLAFDSSGKRLAAASWDGAIRVWQTDSWELLESHKAHEQSISALAFGPRGDLVSASLEGRLLYWRQEAASRQTSAIIAGRPDSVWIAAYSPDGRTLFVGGRGKRFELWDLPTQELRVSREGHPTTRCAAFSPDGRILVTGGDDGIVAQWDARTGERKPDFGRHPGAVSAVVFTASGDTLVSACDGRQVKIWDAKTGNEKATWREHRQQIYCANISPDDKWLITGGGDWASDARGELIVWDLAAGEVRARLDGHRLAIWTIAFSPDGRLFATSSSSGDVKVWDLETLAELQNLRHSMWTRALAFSPDGGTLAVGQGDGSIRLWSSSNWKPAATLAGHESFVFGLQFSPDGRTLATAGNDGTVRFWTEAKPLRRD